jgi:hypothetical protein
MRTVSEKLLALPEKRAPRPAFKTFWAYVFSKWKLALVFCLSVAFFLWSKYWSLSTSASTHSVPWLRVFGLELLSSTILLFTFGALYASHRSVYGRRRNAFVGKNKRETKQ